MMLYNGLHFTHPFFSLYFWFSVIYIFNEQFIIPSKKNFVCTLKGCSTFIAIHVYVHLLQNYCLFIKIDKKKK